jgi:hypothetical protein
MCWWWSGLGTLEFIQRRTADLGLAGIGTVDSEAFMTQSRLGKSLGYWNELRRQNHID